MTAKGIDKLAPGALALVGVLLSGAAFASARFEASAGDAPTQPTSLDGVAKSSSRVRLTWVDNSENESSFEVQYKEIPGRWMDAGSVEAGVEHATVSGLTPAAKYKFRVRAVNSFGKSKWSNRLRLTLSIERPNILLIISDDQGIDASSQYSVVTGASKLMGISRHRLGSTMKCDFFGLMMLYITVPFSKRVLRI